MELEELNGQPDPIAMVGQPDSSQYLNSTFKTIVKIWHGFISTTVFAFLFGIAFNFQLQMIYDTFADVSETPNDKASDVFFALFTQFFNFLVSMILSTAWRQLGEIWRGEEFFYERNFFKNRWWNLFCTCALIIVLDLVPPILMVVSLAQMLSQSGEQRIDTQFGLQFASVAMMAVFIMRLAMEICNAIAVAVGWKCLQPQIFIQWSAAIGHDADTPDPVADETLQICCFVPNPASEHVFKFDLSTYVVFPSKNLKDRILVVCSSVLSLLFFAHQISLSVVGPFSSYLAGVVLFIFSLFFLVCTKNPNHPNFSSELWVRIFLWVGMLLFVVGCILGIVNYLEDYYPFLSFPALGLTYMLICKMGKSIVHADFGYVCDIVFLVLVSTFYFAFMIAYLVTNSKGVFISPGPQFLLVFMVLLEISVLWVFYFSSQGAYRPTSFYLLFALLSVVFTGMMVQYESNSGSECPQLTGAPIPSSATPYPICIERWNNLTITDFVAFSILAYDDLPTAEQNLVTWFGKHPTGNWTIANAVEGGSEQQFYEFYNQRLNLSVISIRGTTTQIDLLQDASFWNQVAILQIVNLVFPVFTFWSKEFQIRVVYAMSLGSMFGYSTKKFYQNVTNTLENLIPQRQTILLTGHSLGGGIANLMAGLYNLSAITVSAPGVDISRLRLGIAENVDLRSLLTNVIPERDIVPMVDFPSGKIQYINCGLANPLDCHKAVHTMKILTDSCGDELGRIPTSSPSLGDECVAFQIPS